MKNKIKPQKCPQKLPQDLNTENKLVRFWNAVHISALETDTAAVNPISQMTKLK